MGDWAYCERHGATSIVDDSVEETFANNMRGRRTFQVIRYACGCEVSTEMGPI